MMQFEYISDKSGERNKLVSKQREVKDFISTFSNSNLVVELGPMEICTFLLKRRTNSVEILRFFAR